MKLRPIAKAVLLAFPSSLAIGAAGIASAQQAEPPKAEPQKLESITVTATKRESALKDVPFSINAQTSEDIQRSGAVTLEDLSRNVAGEHDPRQLVKRLWPIAESRSRFCPCSSRLKPRNMLSSANA